MTSERFWDRVDKTPTCWLWTGHTTQGYGTIRVDGRTVRVHRFSWEMVNGPVPEGLELDHLCRVRNCVNPDHLEPVTHVENTMRGLAPPAINARRLVCRKGHPLDFSHATSETSTGVRRRCRTCQREANARWRATRDDKRTARTRLTPDDVREMRALHKEGWTLQQIAERFKTTGMYAEAVVAGRKWRSVQ